MGSGFFGRRSPLKTANNQITSAAQLTLKQSLVPLTLVTSLFFLWGFSYGLLDTLNKHFQISLGITRTRSSGLQAAYFGAYPLASLGYAGWMLRHWGYKPVFIFGLCTYAVGAFMMWPATVYRSFGGFCGATFLCGSGLGSLETAANPYLAVCGPPRYSEIRINFAQAFNGIGSVVAPALASYVFFKDTVDDSSSLKTVQWVYLAVGVFAFVLAFLFFLSHIPEVTDADMELQVQETHIEGTDKPFIKQYRLFHAALTQFCYCGAQVSIATWFINYTIETRPGSTASLAAKLLAGAQAGFTIGRFSGTFLMHFFRPRKVFLVYLGCVCVFLAAACSARGNAGVAMLFMTLFFESICFPTIVALGIRGLGRHYKRGSGFIIGGVIGGGCVPALTGKVADLHNSTGIAMVVPLAFMLLAVTYPICVNFIPYYRIPADALGSSTIGTTGVDEEKHHDLVSNGMIEPNNVTKSMDGAQIFEIEKKSLGLGESHSLTPSSGS